MSSSNKLLIKFVSDEKIEARGFALTYKFLWGVPNVIRCDFNEQDLCRGWLQDHFDELDWKIRSGPTSSPNTGPQRGIDNSSYVYVEASSPATYGDSAQLISAFMFMAPGELYCLSFQYHMFGKEIGTLQVYTTERGFNVGKRLIWSRSGNQGDQWKIAQVPITGPVQFNSQESFCFKLLIFELVVTPDYNQILFKATRGGNFEGDIALENVRVQRGKCGVGEDVSLWNEEDHAFTENVIQTTESPVSVDESALEIEEIKNSQKADLEAQE